MKRFLIIPALFSLWVLVLSCKSGVSSAEKQRQPPMVHDSPFATLLDSLRHAYTLPALAGAIVCDTGAIEAQAVGCRRFGGPENVTKNDQFHLGSDTKAITAALIGLLVDDGLLNWNSTLPALFPEHAETMRSEYRSVTVRELLSHSAGFTADPALSPTKTTLIEQRREVLAWALTNPPAGAKGKYSYSNTGYIIAGAIADKVAGRPYEELLFERILQPLGITTAGFGPMGTAGLDDQPLQHTPQYNPLEPGANADNPPVYNSAGRLHMSIGDWGRTIRWVLACEAGHPVLMRAETTQLLTRGVVPMPGEGSYAFGWAVLDRPWANGRTLTHSGSNTFNLAVAWLAPNRKFAVIAATNICANTTPAGMDAVIWRLIGYHLNGE
jgi:CubicO group peptidase (beta-lactamase class C family)